MNTTFHSTARRICRPMLPKVILTGLALVGLGWVMQTMPTRHRGGCTGRG